MLDNLKQLFHLQFFDGAGTGGDGGGDGGAAATGASTGDAGQNETARNRTLEELGVPKDKAEKYRARKARVSAPAADDDPPAEEGEASPAGENAQGQAAAAQGLDWDTLRQNPEFNARMQEIVTSRTKKMRGALDDLGPALELIARQYGVDYNPEDPGSADFKALAKAVTEDDRYYEDRASDMGVDVETAKRIDRLEADKRRNDARQQQLQQDMKLRQHFESMRQQAEALKAKIPGFDLNKEMQNPAFVRMTRPEGGLSLEQAFWALHHDEVTQAKQVQTAQQVASALSKSVQAGRNMPTENGTRARASSGVVNKLYSQMNAEERRQYKADLKSGRRKF